MTRLAPRPKDLVDAVRSGDEGAAGQLLDAWLPTILAWARRLSGPGVDPEDVAHDAMIVVLRRLDTLDDPARFAGWVFRVVRSTITAHRRRAWLRRWVPGASTERADPSADPLRSAERSQTVRLVQEALHELPIAQREALVLCDVEERTAEEAATLLGVPVGTVKSRLRLGRERFRKAASLRGLAPALLTPSGGGDP